MGKADFGSAKFQAKQLKASGLQKLRFYCQLCKKQCRDANGFKNHLNSPSHLGRISNLSKDGKATSVIGEFSAQFERDFLRLLRINHGTKKISANKFYQEYILNDKDHVHMNATRWGSLTSFVKYLGQSGKVEVELPPDEEDEFNLFIRLVDVQSNPREKEKMLQSDAERQAKFLKAQIEYGKKLEEAEAEKTKAEKTEGEPESEEKANPKPVAAKPISLSLKGLGPKKKVAVSAFHDSDEE